MHHVSFDVLSNLIHKLTVNLSHHLKHINNLSKVFTPIRYMVPPSLILL